MSFPAEGLESAYRNHAEDVRALLEGRHPGSFTVYNVSGRSYPATRYSIIFRIEFFQTNKLFFKLHGLR